MASLNKKSQIHSEQHKLSVAEKFTNLKKHFAPVAPVPVPVLPTPPLSHIQHVYYEEKDVLFIPEEPDSSP